MAVLPGLSIRQQFPLAFQQPRPSVNLLAGGPPKTAKPAVNAQQAAGAATTDAVHQHAQQMLGAHKLAAFGPRASACGEGHLKVREMPWTVDGFEEFMKPVYGRMPRRLAKGKDIEVGTLTDAKARKLEKVALISQVSPEAGSNVWGRAWDAVNSGVRGVTTAIGSGLNSLARPGEQDFRTAFLPSIKHPSNSKVTQQQQQKHQQIGDDLLAGSKASFKDLGNALNPASDRTGPSNWETVRQKWDQKYKPSLLSSVGDSLGMIDNPGVWAAPIGVGTATNLAGRIFPRVGRVLNSTPGRIAQWGVPIGAEVYDAVTDSSQLPNFAAQPPRANTPAAKPPLAPGIREQVATVRNAYPQNQPAPQQQAAAPAPAATTPAQPVAAKPAQPAVLAHPAVQAALKDNPKLQAWAAQNAPAVDEALTGLQQTLGGKIDLSKTDPKTLETVTKHLQTHMDQLNRWAGGDYISYVLGKVSPDLAASWEGLSTGQKWMFGVAGGLGLVGMAAIATGSIGPGMMGLGGGAVAGVLGAYGDQLLPDVFGKPKAPAANATAAAPATGAAPAVNNVSYVTPNRAADNTLSGVNTQFRQPGEDGKIVAAAQIDPLPDKRELKPDEEYLIDQGKKQWFAQPYRPGAPLATQLASPWRQALLAGLTGGAAGAAGGATLATKIDGGSLPWVLAGAGVGGLGAGGLAAALAGVRRSELNKSIIDFMRRVSPETMRRLQQPPRDLKPFFMSMQSQPVGLDALASFLKSSSVKTGSWCSLTEDEQDAIVAQVFA